MKILHVTSSIDARAGGTAFALVGLALAQRRMGQDVAVLSTYREGADFGIAEKLRAAGVTVHLVGPARGPLQRHPDLAATVDAAVAGADVAHLFGLWEEAQHAAAVAARRHGKPYVFAASGMLSPWSLAQSRWKKRVYMLWRLRRDLRRAAAVTCTSAVEAEHVAALRLGPPVIVEPLGVDPAEFDPPPPAKTFRQRYPQIGDRPLVTFLGRVYPGKGLEYLVPALAKVKSSDAVLAVVGPDEHAFRAELEAVARAHGVADRVIFTGMLAGRDRVAALADADLFALPSDHENFGLAIVEALAAGTPALISDQVNIYRELEQAGVVGVVKNDVEAVAAGLERWLGDAGLRRAAADRARPLVRERYDWAAIAARWVGHYERLIGGR